MASRGKKKKQWKAVKELEYSKLIDGYDYIINNLDHFKKEYEHLGETAFFKKYGIKENKNGKSK